MKVIKASKFVVTLWLFCLLLLSSCSFRTTTHRSNYKAKGFRQDTQKKLMEIKRQTLCTRVIKIKTNSESELVFFLSDF
jgi:outer membrane biogenesis lipoprotein LolB